MQHRFHIKVSFFVYLFLIFGSFCTFWLILIEEEPYRIILSCIGFIVLITLTIVLMFLQISKRGGISVDSNFLYVHNVPTLIIPLKDIRDIEIGYNGNKKNMIIRYFKEGKVKRIGFGQMYSDSLINIKKYIDSVVSRQPQTNTVINTIEGNSNNQQLKHKQESLICCIIPLVYLLLSFIVYNIDFIDSKTIIYIIFGLSFLIEIVLSIIQYRKLINAARRIYISFALLLCSSVYLILSMILAL